MMTVWCDDDDDDGASGSNTDASKIQNKYCKLDMSQNPSIYWLFKLVICSFELRMVYLVWYLNYEIENSISV